LPQTTRTSSNDSQLIYLKLCYSELQYHVVLNCPLKIEVTDSFEPMVTIYDCIWCHEKDTIQIFTATKISKFPTQKPLTNAITGPPTTFRSNINMEACHKLY
jgi:hypothetical protein